MNGRPWFVELQREPPGGARNWSRIGALRSATQDTAAVAPRVSRSRKCVQILIVFNPESMPALFIFPWPSNSSNGCRYLLLIPVPSFAPAHFSNATDTIRLPVIRLPVMARGAFLPAVSICIGFMGPASPRTADTSIAQTDAESQFNLGERCYSKRTPGKDVRVRAIKPGGRIRRGLARWQG